MSKDEATWAEIRRAYEAGDETVSALAKRFGVSAGTIYRHARKCGWASRS
ncbi:MAG: helix-turn-helix domain-containing protein [Filomicrobium sp.]